MLAIGRALMLRPKLMLLDEPSFGLAPLIVEELFGILRTLNEKEGVSMLLVEQNAALALELADHAYLLETGRIVLSAPRARSAATRTSAALLDTRMMAGHRRMPRRRSIISGFSVVRGPARDDDTDENRIGSEAWSSSSTRSWRGSRPAAIYACMALAIVMIYQAIDHLNFAQGEMAMFSTFIAWQLMQWGFPYWAAFFATIAISFVGGVLIERIVFKPLDDAPVLSHVVGVHRAVRHHQQPGRLHLGLHHQALPDAVRHQVAVRNGLISAHDAGMIAMTLVLLVLLYVFFRHTRLGLAMRAAAANPDSARLVGIRVGWMIALGWGMAAAIGAVAGMLIAPVVFLEPNMMLTHPALRLRRRGARRADQPGRRGGRRIRGRRHREPGRHVHSGGRRAS